MDNDGFLPYDTDINTLSTKTISKMMIQNQEDIPTKSHMSASQSINQPSKPGYAVHVRYVQQLPICGCHDFKYFEIRVTSHSKSNESSLMSILDVCARSCFR